MAHNVTVHNYIDTEQYQNLANFIGYEFSINLPCTENHILTNDRAWLNEMVYKTGLNFITETTSTFERIMQIESVFGKADTTLCV